MDKSYWHEYKKRKRIDELKSYTIRVSEFVQEYYYRHDILLTTRQAEKLMKVNERENRRDEDEDVPQWGSEPIS